MLPAAHAGLTLAQKQDAQAQEMIELLRKRTGKGLPSVQAVGGLLWC